MQLNPRKLNSLSKESKHLSEIKTNNKNENYCMCVQVQKCNDIMFGFATKCLTH